jgi:hypothetical protein
MPTHRHGLLLRDEHSVQAERGKGSWQCVQACAGCGAAALQFQGAAYRLLHMNSRCNVCVCVLPTPFTAHTWCGWVFTASTYLSLFGLPHVLSGTLLLF